MKRNLIFSILGVLAISGIAFTGTYAFYMASSETTIDGEVESGINTTLSLETTYSATQLVPLSDNLITTAISKANNKCIDKNNYDVCSLYKITLTNEGPSENLYGYVRTGETTYTTDNLKYQVFDSNFNALTDVMTVSKTAETSVYFQKSSSNYTTVSGENTVYYLAMWLTDTKTSQSEDYSKTFSGYIGFESVNFYGSGTGRIEAEL